jgi:hypothetical protein
MTDHGELRRLAEAAREVAPGEWAGDGILIYYRGGMICEMSEPHATQYVEHKPLSISSPEWKAAMTVKAHIAAASPATVLALLDERDRLAELLKKLEHSFVDGDSPNFVNMCPICHMGDFEDHAPDCELARALRGEG